MKSTYQRVAPTVAIVMSALSLTMGGAIAGGQLVIKSSSQIRDGAIKASDIKRNSITAAKIRRNAVRAPAIRRNSIRTSAIQPGAVTSNEVQDGAVVPEDVSFPDGVQIVQDAPASAPQDATPSPLAVPGTYAKESPDSDLVVSWTGTARASDSACIFQLYVDGQPAADGAGEVYVPTGGQPESVSATAKFSGLPPGPHRVEVWARSASPHGEHDCTVGPAEAQISQTYTVEEAVR